MKCVNCGGEHFPGQSICSEVQKIRQERNNQRTFAQAASTQPRLAIQTVSERLKYLTERLDGVSKWIEFMERITEQEKNFKDYYAAFGRYVQEIREKEEVSKTESASNPATSVYQTQIPRYSIPTWYQCSKLEHIRR